MTLSKQWRRFLRRVATLCVVTGVLLAIPDSDTGDILRYKNALVAFAFVISLGKLLYDTFFFDRYLP